MVADVAVAVKRVAYARAPMFLSVAVDAAAVGVVVAHQTVKLLLEDAFAVIAAKAKEIWLSEEAAAAVAAVQSGKDTPCHVAVAAARRVCVDYRFVGYIH